MKKISLCFFLLLIGSIGFSQILTPVKWTYSAKKIADKTYEVHATAAINSGWHIYTLDHNSDIGIATSVKFNKNPLALANGKLMAKGKVVKVKDPSIGELVKFYENSVDIVQIFKLKTAVKTNITGTLEYMTCDDKQCLPPTSNKFSVSLQ